MEKNIVFQNLTEENATFPDALERRFSHLSEAARLLLPEEPISKEELPGVLADVGQELLSRLSATEVLPSHALTSHMPALHQAFSDLCEHDMAFFAQRMASLLSDRGLSLIEALPTVSSPYHVAYLQNPMTEKVFDQLSRRFPDAVKLPVESFRMAAEAVTEGRAVACFLPMEDATLHKIPTFFSLLEQYNFTIQAQEAEDDSVGSTRYLLLSYHRLPIRQAKRQYFSCRYIPSKKSLPGAVLRAAAFYGLSPLRFSMDLAPSSEQPSYLFTASFDRGDPVAFLTYLYLFSASVSFYGIYS